MNPSRVHEKQCQRKNAFHGRKSLKTRLLAGIAAATLLVVLFSTATLASPTAIVTLAISGSISAVNAPMALHTVGRDIYDAGGNKVFLRGIGVFGNGESLTGYWHGTSPPSMDWGGFETNKATLTANINGELSLFKNTWHSNVVRILIPVDWWYYDNLTAAWNGTTMVIQPYPNPSGNPLYSYRNYTELLVQLAQSQGVYVDFCLFSMVSPYKVPNSKGIPMVPASRDAETQSWLTSVVGGNETAFWMSLWDGIAQRLGKYPNVIFEMWNEPCTSTTSQVDPNRFAYYNQYLYPCYQEIRSHTNNLITMQYYTGVSPNWRDFAYAGEIYSALNGLAISNLVFTTHFYRDIPDFGVVTDWGTDQATINSQMNTMMASYTPPCPLVVTEMGVATDMSMYGNSAYVGMSTETWAMAMGFWNSILNWCRTNNVGFIAEYWMCQDATFGINNEAMLQAGSINPNDVGAAFLTQTSQIGP